MRTKLLNILNLLIVIIVSVNVNAQGVAVNINNLAPDSSAILDVSSSVKGMLVPRLSTAERDAVNSPALSLLIYNTTTNCFEFWAMGNWHELGCATSPCGGYEGTTYEFEIDYQGYTYKLVEIGTQCWFAENLRSTKLNDDASMASPDTLSWLTETNPAYTWYLHDSLTYNQYGALYNGYAVGSGKLCPDGWVVPGDTAWMVLEEAIGVCVGSPYGGWPNGCTWDNGDGGGRAFQNQEGLKLRSTTWNGTDDYGFNVIPAGYLVEDPFTCTPGPCYSRFFNNELTHAPQYIATQFWTSTPTDIGSVGYNNGYWDRLFQGNEEGIGRYPSYIEDGASVRCLKE